MTNNYKKALNTMPDGTDMGELAVWGLKNMEAIRQALDLAIALQPKPISEAPVNQAVFNGGAYIMNRPRGNWVVLATGRVLDWQPTHFYDISALPKPEVDYG